MLQQIDRAHKPTCDELLGWHVVYDKTERGYRANVRCWCGETSHRGKRVHNRVMLAEAESRALLANLRRE